MRVLFQVVVILALVGCTVAKDDSSQIIVKVNGDNVPASEFTVVYEKLKSQLDEISQPNPKVMEDLKTRALNEIITIALLRQEAAKREIQIAKEEVEGRLANWKEGYPPGGFEEMLRKRNTTENYLKKRIADQLLIEKVTEALFGTETLVSDEEMKTHYTANRSDFFQPSRVHAFQIVVPTVEEANRVRQEVLSDKMTFESAARKYSLSPDAATGGDLGFFARNEKIAAFNKAFSLKLGEISKPIQSKYGVHLIKVVEKKPATKLKYSQAKDEVAKAIRRKKEAKVYQEWVTKLLKDGEIYRNDSLYASIN